MSQLEKIKILKEEYENRLNEVIEDMENEEDEVNHAYIQGKKTILEEIVEQLEELLK